MRVAQKTMYDMTRFRLGKITDDLNNATTFVSTGKRLNKAEDDPIGFTQVLSLKSNVSYLEQIKRNTGTGKTWLNAGETALSSVQDIITQAKTVALSMSGGNADSSVRSAAAEQIRGYVLQMESLANTRVQGQYIFSGTKTDTQAFALDSQQIPTTATYSGNDVAYSIMTAKDTTIEVGHDGDSVFSNLFSSMISLYSDLKSNNPAGIGNAMDNLDTDFDTITSTISGIGAKGVRINTKEKIIADLSLRYTENQAELEDADIVEAITQLKAAELAYQAALSSSAKLMQMSLVDFL